MAKADNGKRVTVILEDRLMAKITKEVRRRQKSANYQVTVAEVVRELVSTLP